MSQDVVITAPSAELSDEFLLIRYDGSMHCITVLLGGNLLKHSVKLVNYELVQTRWAVLATACLLQESQVNAVLQKKGCQGSPQKDGYCCPLNTVWSGGAADNLA